MMREDWSGLSTFQVGSVLSVAWRTLFSAPGIFIGLTFVSNFVTAIVAIVTNTRTVFGVSEIVTLLLNMILSIVIQGAIAYAVFQVIAGGRASLGESVAKSASKIFALIGLAILSGIGVSFAFLLIIPGLILLCMWYVAAPACVVERLGPIESLGRSRALTKGYRWQVFGVMALLFLLAWLIYILVAFLTGVFLTMIFASGTALRGVLITIVAGFARLIPNAFVNVASAVAYYRLRMVKENLTMENLADVFD